LHLSFHLYEPERQSGEILDGKKIAMENLLVVVDDLALFISYGWAGGVMPGIMG
jgi:hypothetical protein